MNILRPLVAIVACVLSPLAAQAEYVTLTKQNPSILLNPTDIVLIVGTSEHGRGYNSEESMFITLEGQPESEHFITSYAGPTVNSALSQQGNVISGVTKIRIGKKDTPNVNEGFYVTLSILKQGQQLLSTPMVTPGTADSKYEITLETSTDMQNWTPTVPGEFLGNSGQRFFRVRAVVKPAPNP